MMKPGEVIEVTPANLTRIAMECIEGQEAVKRLRGLLRDLQFANDQDECKVCYSKNPAHLPSCRLAAALKEEG